MPQIKLNYTTMRAMDKFISTFNEEERLGNLITVLTIAQCDCGKSWIVRTNGKWKYTQEEWWQELVTHFTTVDHTNLDGE